MHWEALLLPLRDGYPDPGIRASPVDALRYEESITVSLAGAQRSNFVSTAMEPLREP